MYATENGDLEMVKLLIENHANPNIKPFNGVTAIINAAIQNQFEIAEYLVNHGANINAQDENGVTAIHYSAAYNDFEITDMLIFYGADISIADNKGNTPLITAAYNNSYETAELLIQKGADINEPDKKGFSPLMVATDRNNTNIIKLLLEKGADVNAVNLGGMTPLSFAVIRKDYAITETLINEGANVNHRINNSLNILELAKESDDEEIIELLEVEGARPNRMPNFTKMTLGWGLNFNADDFMTGLNFGLCDHKYNIGLNSSFCFRPSAVRILKEESPDILYQFWERRFCFSIGLDKKFPIIQNNNILSGPVVSIDGIYTFGSYRGSELTPESRFIIQPGGGWFIGNNLLTARLMYNYFDLGIPEMSKGRISLDIAFNISLRKKSMLTKRIDWLMY